MAGGRKTQALSFVSQPAVGHLALAKGTNRSRVQIVQSGRDFIELRFTSAYKELFDAPIDAGGESIASLVRFGKYEVRLIRLPRALSTAPLPIWLELYSHETQSVIDSCGSHDRAQASQAAVYLASRARTLDDELRKSRWSDDSESE